MAWGEAANLPTARPIYWGAPGTGRAWRNGPATGFYECVSFSSIANNGTGTPLKDMGAVWLGNDPNIVFHAVTWSVQSATNSRFAVKLSSDGTGTGTLGGIFLESDNFSATDGVAYVTDARFTDYDYSENTESATPLPYLLFQTRSTGGGSYANMTVNVWFSRSNKGHINTDPGDD